MFAATATEDDGIGNSITSEAVKAVYASRHFSCRIQPRNRTALDVQHLAFRRYRHPTHRMMNAGSNSYCIERSLFNTKRHIGTTECFVFSCLAELVVVAGRLFESFRIHVTNLGQLSQSISFLEHTQVIIALHHLCRLIEVAVKKPTKLAFEADAKLRRLRGHVL